MFLRSPGPQQHTYQTSPAFYRLRDVVRITSMSRSTIYRRVAAGRFPRPISLGGRASAWKGTELQAWIEDPMTYRAAP